MLRTKANAETMRLKGDHCANRSSDDISIKIEAIGFDHRFHKNLK